MSQSRRLWDVDCDLQSRDCQGTSIVLDSLEEDGEFGPLDMTQLVDMHVSQAADGIYELVWGVHSLEVDTNLEMVRYTENGSTSTGAGVGSLKSVE